VVQKMEGSFVGAESNLPKTCCLLSSSHPVPSISIAIDLYDGTDQERKCLVNN
jgi:hypothetical protein